MALHTAAINECIPANGNIYRACARIFAVRQGRIGRRVLVAVRKVKPDAALRQKDRAGAENVSVRGYNYRKRETGQAQRGKAPDFAVAVEFS